MNSSKKGEGVPILDFKGVSGPTSKLWGGPESRVPGSRGSWTHFDTMPISQRESKTRVCVYCSSKGHKSNECEKVRGIQEHQKILSEKRLIYNSAQHHVSAGKSKRSYQLSRIKHDACDRRSSYPPCCNSYASAALLNRLKVKPIKKETKNNDMVVTSTTRYLEFMI